MTNLVAAGNTYNPSLIVLRTKGYHLWIDEDGERNLWNASREGNKFMAYSPPELLGIVSLWEALGDDWNQQKPDILGELSDE